MKKAAAKKATKASPKKAVAKPTGKKEAAKPKTTKAPTVPAKMPKKGKGDRPVELAPMAERDLEADLGTVIRAVAKLNGSSPVGWQKILAALALPESAQTKEWALKIFDALVDRDAVVKGVLNRESPETQRLLFAKPQEETAEVIGTAQGAKLMTVALSEVSVCPLNPRKTVDPASIEEMAASIIEHDIVQPPIARSKKGGGWEVVFGQRRLLGKKRAAEMTGMKPAAATIQLLVREMGDRTVLEEAWVENLQRVDVGVREEVEGFRAMLDLRDEAGAPVYSAASLAKKIGKSKAFVSQRLKLSNVPEEMWQALEAKVIGVRQMELVGRLPDEASRKKLAGMILRPRFRVEPPLTVRETVDLLRDEFMTSLRGCEWNLKDETLVPVKRDKHGSRISGGACSDCPFRTGGDPELQECLSSNQHEGGKQGIDANSCMLPTCFQAKKEAVWKRTMKDASESGAKVLSPEEAKKVFASWGGDSPLPSAGLVSLSESPGFQETGHHAAEDTLPSWSKMIGKVDPADLIVARNEATGAICQLMKRERAIELAEKATGKKGKDSPFANRPGTKKGSGGEGGQEQGGAPKSEWQIKREEHDKINSAIWAKFAEAINLHKMPPEDAVVEIVLASQVDEVGYGYGLAKFFEAQGLPKFDDEGEGDEGTRVRRWLDEVLRPEVARAPFAWLAVVVLEHLVNVDFSEPRDSDGLLKALALDRDEILAIEESEEKQPAEVTA